MSQHSSMDLEPSARRCVAWHSRTTGVLLAKSVVPHVCTPTCPQWVDTVGCAAVCTLSLRVHQCGRECTLPRIDLPANEGYMCPLTKMVFPDMPIVQTPMFDKGGRCINHWSTFGVQKKPKKKRRLPRWLTYPRCLAAATAILTGKHRDRIRVVEVSRACKRLQRTCRRAAPVGSFAALARRVADHVSAVSPMPNVDWTRVLQDMCWSIFKYTTEHPRCAFGTNDVTVATWLTLLSCGISHNGVDVVPRVDALCRAMPPPALMAMVPKINCRAISVARRAFLKYVYTPSGMPIFSRVFKLRQYKKCTATRDHEVPGGVPPAL